MHAALAKGNVALRILHNGQMAFVAVSPDSGQADGGSDAGGNEAGGDSGSGDDSGNGSDGGSGGDQPG